MASPGNDEHIRNATVGLGKERRSSNVCGQRVRRWSVHFRQIGLEPQITRPRAAETLGSFKPRYEISYDRHELLAPAGEKRIGADEERTGLQLDERAKAPSISLSVPAFRIISCTPLARAAACKSRIVRSVLALFRFE
jgi:hypothetical protein